MPRSRGFIRRSKLSSCKKRCLLCLSPSLLPFPLFLSLFGALAGCPKSALHVFCFVFLLPRAQRHYRKPQVRRVSASGGRGRGLRRDPRCRHDLSPHGALLRRQNHYSQRVLVAGEGNRTHGMCVCLYLHVYTCTYLHISY